MAAANGVLKWPSQSFLLKYEPNFPSISKFCEIFFFVLKLFMQSNSQCAICLLKWKGPYCKRQDRNKWPICNRSTWKIQEKDSNYSKRSGLFLPFIHNCIWSILDNCCIQESFLMTFSSIFALMDFFVVA